MKKSIAILGSTGSIGTQALEVISQHPERFEVEVLTANNNYQLLAEQARYFLPDTVVIGNETHYESLKRKLADLPIKVFAGYEAISQVVQMQNIDMVLTAMVGYAGLRPTLSAIEAGKDIALANKETLVVAGKLIIDLARQKRVRIIPVDSEHSAIYQCLVGEGFNKIEKIILTASGGPFHKKDLNALKNVTPEEALKHPNWEMGAKITIDSASLMNKGFEAIEAKWLFNLDPAQIEVLVHPQSIVHSMVQFEDGSIKAQMGLPDMKLPILYAFSFPERLKSDFPRLHFKDYPNLSFEQPDTNKFTNLNLAYRAMEAGGNVPCMLNAANEIVVQAFLEKKISFVEMSEIIHKTMDVVQFIPKPSLEDFEKTDEESRRLALSFI
ncbi:MAG: 1-deoxy-D-xylulose-5-phosphate reductoisomerase [Bacteroidales bacterium]|nr:1-deoxy-D-xylulose-5-phosphate reductoisomerase [Bacteroidales bacterium]